MPTPDPIAWNQLPADAQRILSGRANACTINLWFEDNGTPVFCPSVMGYHLGMLLLEYGTVIDAMRCATEFTESLS